MPSSIAKKSLRYTLKIKSNNNKITRLKTEIEKLENSKTNDSESFKLALWDIDLTSLKNELETFISLNSKLKNSLKQIKDNWNELKKMNSENESLEFENNKQDINKPWSLQENQNKRKSNNNDIENKTKKLRV